MHFSRNLLLLWIVGISFILITYFWLDKDLSTFIYTHHWRENLLQIPGLKIIIEWPPQAFHLAPIIFFTLLISRCRKSSKNSQWQSMLLILCLSVFLTHLLKDDMKWIFGRYWPTTWKNNNLSWINNQAYGYQWLQGKFFEGTDATGSFPSGHASVAFATFISIGLCYPKSMKVCILLATLEALFMVAFNYHFLSDVIAGACLGTTCAVLCYRLLSIR